MNYEHVPIAQFVSQRFSSPQVQKLVEAWRVEPQIVIDKIVDYFREMGIFKVTPGHEALLTKNMMHQLRNSPELNQLVNRAKQEELKRQRNRHAE